MLIVVVLAVLLGSAVQRLTGMGFAMVLAPFAVIALGPSSGVVLVNLLGLVSASLVLSRVVAAVEWRVVWSLLPAGGVGVLLGVAVGTGLGTEVAQVLAGTVVLLALAASLAVRTVTTLVRSRSLIVAASTASGIMAALAGVGGAAMAVLAVLTRWDQDRFIATMQPYFFALGLGTIAARLIADPRAWPVLPGYIWLLVALAMALGLVLGEHLGKRVTEGRARAAVIVISGMGGVLAIVDGLHAG